MAKGREIAERYGVLDLLLPIIEFDPSAYKDDQIPTKDQVKSIVRSQNNNNNEQPQYMLASSPPLSPMLSMDSPASPYASSPSSSTGYYNYLPMTRPSPHEEPHHHHPRKKQKTMSTTAPRTEVHRTEAHEDAHRHRSILMSLFLTEDTLQAPEWLKDKVPHDLDINIAIDDQGHTALHWAASLGRIKTLELLVSRGADIRRSNIAGETPLMRSVMMTNSYDADCFPRLLDILYDSILATDNKKRTLLHHIALAAGIPGRSSAAVHYLTTVFNATRNFEQAQTLYNMTDYNGDTALDIAKRVDCKSLADLFLHRDENAKTTEKPVRKLHIYSTKRGDFWLTFLRRTNRQNEKMALYLRNQLKSVRQQKSINSITLGPNRLHPVSIRVVCIPLS